MKFITSFSTALLLASVLFSTTSASASLYLGGGLGLSTISIASNYVNGIDKFKDLEDTGFKAFAGYKFNPMFSLEAQYTDFGKFTYRKLMTETNAESSSFGGAVVAHLPMWIIRPYAKLGMHSWNLDGTFSALGTTVTQIKPNSGTDLYYGIGADLTILPLIDIGLEYERYEMDDNNMDYIGATVKVGF